MDLAAFQRGEMDALAAAVDAAAPAVWILSRSGFTTTDDGVAVYVQGIDDPDITERVVSEALAAALTPQKRQTIGHAEAIRRTILTEARAKLIAYGNRSGRTLSLIDEAERVQVPEGIDDIDRLIADDATPAVAAQTMDPEAHARWAAACDAFTESLDARGQTLVRMRFREGKSHADVATEFTCGVAAVKEHERRLRHHVTHALRSTEPAARFGAARVDALLAGRSTEVVPPPVTLERLQRDVLKRTFQEEPPPFSSRLAWALGVTAIALCGWLLMFFGVLPSPADDPVGEPALELSCAPRCEAGAQATAFVRAPAGARQMGIVAVDGPTVTPLLMSPEGGSLGLPFGARTERVRVPYPFGLAEDLGPNATVVVVFTEKHLTEAQLADVARGAPRDGTRVAFFELGAGAAP